MDWKKIDENCGEITDDYDVAYNQSGGFDEGIRTYFDPYSDHIPEHDDMFGFLKQNTLYALCKNGVTVAGLVISVHGKVQTEEFIFVDKEYRGKGLSERLHNLMYGCSKYDDELFVAWIEDGNIPCIKLHEKLGYEKQSTYKITLKKGRY